jgi:hypothetical protein
MKLPLVPQDKANHYIYGSVIYFITSLCLSPILSLIVVLLIAFLKELYDYKTKKGTPEVMDIVWTMIGGLTIMVTQILSH